MHQTVPEPAPYRREEVVALESVIPAVVVALQSADPQRQASAAGAGQDLLRTLDQIAGKKRSVDDTMALLMREIRAARRQKIGRIVGTIVLIGMVIALLALRIPIGGFGWLFFKLLGVFWVADRAVDVRRHAARTLGEAGDPRAVGVLAIALQDGDGLVRHGAEEALHKLLPRVRAGDAAYITADAMQALLSLLETGSDSLRIVLLQALEQIGDERAIPYVNYLMVFGPPTVRRQAEACLPFLEERVRLARESATLLRASSLSAVAAAPEHLLRPASAASTPSVPADHLLRPVQSPAQE